MKLLENIVFWLFVVAGILTGVCALYGLRGDLLDYMIYSDISLFILLIIVALFAAEKED